MLAEAIVGWLVQVIGTAGARAVVGLTVGSRDARALREAMSAALDAVVDHAPEGGRESLRNALLERFSESPQLPTGLEPLRDRLRKGIRAQLEPLADPALTPSGRSFLDEIGIQAVWLEQAMFNATVQAIKTVAVSGTLAAVAAQLNADEGMEELRALHETVGAPTWPRPAQLPPAPTDFTGRERELAQLHGLLAESVPRAVTVSAIAGKAGVGKSALAVHFARQVAAAFPDGQLYVDLRGEDSGRLTAADALGQILRALGVAGREVPEGVAEQAGLFRSLVDGRRVLILLDSAFDEAQVRPLLPGSPGCLVLVTSRRPLHALESALLPLVLDVLDDAAALDLLGRMAGVPRVRAEPQQAAELVRLCGHLPLALRIAGGRLRGRPQWPLADICRRLADERRRLAELRLGDLDVRASLMLSYWDLDPAQAHLFRQLSVIPGPTFDIEVATIVASLLLAGPGSKLLFTMSEGDPVALPPGSVKEFRAAKPQTDSEVAETLMRVLVHGVEQARTDVESDLEALTDMQLVEPAGGPGRYRLHELVRLFAHERLRDEDTDYHEDKALWALTCWAVCGAAAAADWMVAPDPPLGSEFASQQAAIQWLERERGHLVAIVGIAHALGCDRRAVNLALVLVAFFQQFGYWTDWQATHEVALTAAQQLHDHDAEASLLFGLGVCHMERRHFTRAVAYFEQSLALRPAKETAEDRAQRLATTANAYTCLKRLREADAYLAQADQLLKLGTSRRAHTIAAEVAGSRAVLLERRGDTDAALHHHRRALDEYRLAGHRLGQVVQLNHLGRVLLDYGRLAAAQKSLEESFVLCRGSDVPPKIMAETLLQLGRVRHERGEDKTALKLFDQALAIHHQLQIPDQEAEVLFNRSVALVRLGRWDAAKQCWAEAEQTLERADPAVAEQMRNGFASWRPRRPEA
jgi:tetratricopeptide (TPR) repeat protein